MANKDREGSIREKIPFPRLTGDQCRRIHEASLEVLDRVGVRLELEEAIALLKKAGARVDSSRSAA